MDVSCLRLRACLGARLLPQSYQYPNLSEGADHVGGQLLGDNECLFGGVTKSGRIWRKVLESNARSLRCMLPFMFEQYCIPVLMGVLFVYCLP